jgi:4-amino-4-deoxychorismate lyase
MDNVWAAHNARIQPFETVRISPFSEGFVHGIGVFETFCSKDRRVPLKPHYVRMIDACAQQGIAYAPSFDAIGGLIDALMQRIPDRDVRIRWSIGAQDVEHGMYAPADELIVVAPLIQSRCATELYALCTPRSGAQGARVKTVQYTDNVFARQELRARGVPEDAEGVFLAEGRFVIEGIHTNVFWYTEGAWCTPSTRLGCVRGVTRAHIAAALAQNGGLCYVMNGTMDTLIGSTELFVGNAGQGVIPVTALYDTDNALLKTWDVGAQTMWLRKEVHRLWAGVA